MQENTLENYVKEIEVLRVRLRVDFTNWVNLLAFLCNEECFLNLCVNPKGIKSENDLTV
jgi:hypothetical protein